MRAMLLAAGLGTRMMPLTKDKPKCLLEIAGRALIEYHLHALSQANITDVVINVSSFASVIQAALGNGEKFGVNIQYSYEPEPLETAGGIKQALPLLGDEPFVVINTDVFTDYPLQQLRKLPSNLIHLIMVDNPPHNPQGDFTLQDDKLTLSDDNKLTFSGISLLEPALFSKLTTPKMRLSPLFREAIQLGRASGEYYAGKWLDIGTPERLALANQ